MTLTTANNKSFPVQWCGISSITGELIFDLSTDVSFADAISGFMDADALKTLVYNDGKDDRVIEGFSQINTITRGGDNGAIRIALGRTNNE